MENPNEPLKEITGQGATEEFMQSMRLSRLILPIMLGVIAVAVLFWKQFDHERFNEIQWTSQAFKWLVAAVVLMVLRHFAYTLRMKTLTGFGWRKCAELITIWEFSAALTPTSKGGPFVMFFVLTREKLSTGKTAAAVLYCIILDGGFMVFMLPLLLGIFGPPMLYPGMKSFGDVGLATGTFFFTFAFMLAYWFVFSFFLFIRPQWASGFLEKIGRISILKKFENKLKMLGEEFQLAAVEIKNNGFNYHFKVIIGTFMAWTLKFAMINCLLLAIVPNLPFDGSTQMFIYARMVAMFIIMAFSPTPGGAGLAEVAMAKFITDFVPEGVGVVVALLWRGIAYYGYLLLGAFVVPAWISRRIKKDY